MTSPDHSPPRLHIEDARPAPDGSIHLSLSGELDHEEAGRLRSSLTDVVRRYAPATIRIDASRLTFLDSAGIRALLTCRRVTEQAGSRMSMPWASRNVYQVLEVTGLLTVFGVVEQPDSRHDQPAQSPRRRPPHP